MPIDRRRLAGGLITAVAATDRGIAAPVRASVDDASRLNNTPVAARASVSQRRNLGVEALRASMAEARATSRPLLVAGARHSMGGQSIPRDGHALTFDASPIEVDRAAKSYRVGAGATWRQVIAGLAPLGLSPAVTQSSNDFAVGGALSVNAHGWAAPLGGVAATVRCLKVMLASGEVVKCSPQREPELFSLCLGGYGLFGVILEAELTAVDDAWLEPRRTVMPSAAFGRHFVAVSHEAGVRMIYGRLSMAHGDDFLAQAQLTAYRPAVKRTGVPPTASGDGLGSSIAYGLFRAQSESDAVKRLRWGAETRLQPLYDGPSGRNQLINTSVKSFGAPPRGKTDILHEYFLPPDSLERFLRVCRPLLSRREPDLLNITLRYLPGDRLTTLAYAPQERVAVVMFFNQSMTKEGERIMRSTTSRLIDAALDCGGSFYLPYRLHASRAQIERAYPRLDEALAAKRRLDPGGLFRSLMWDHYFA